MTILCAELIRQQGEFRDRLLNYGLRRTVGVQLVVFDCVNVEPVEARSRSPDRTSRSQDSTLLRGCSWGEYRKLLYVAAQGVDRNVLHGFPSKRGVQG